MMLYQKTIIILGLLFNFYAQQARCLIVGSNTAASRQGFVVFPSTDSNNTMRGFAAFDNGFNLSDFTATCTFDDFWHVNGPINMAGGKLFLRNDLIFDSDFKMLSFGEFFGNNYHLSFPKSRLAIPARDTIFSIDPNIKTITMPDSVPSIDWSFDGNYLAVVDEGKNFRIYYFDGEMLTTTASVTLGEHAYAVRWHPKKHYVAVGKKNSSGNEVEIYHLNTSNGSFAMTSGQQVSGGRDVVALAWRQAGKHVAAGTDGSNNLIIIYPFNDTTGVLSAGTSNSISPDRGVGQGALSFSPGGDFIVVGFEDTPGSLAVYPVTGTTLGSSTTTTPGSSKVFSVDWSLTGTYIAVGLESSSQRVRVYRHNSTSNTITDKTSAYLGETQKVRAVHWSPDGRLLAYGTAEGSASRVNIAFFDEDVCSLSLISIKNNTGSAQDVTSVRWSPQLNALAFAEGDEKEVNVCALPGDGAGQRFLFNNIVISFNGDTVIKKVWKFTGISRICGKGNTLTLDNTGFLEIGSGSHLIIEDVFIRGVQDFNIQCLADNSLVTLRNCELILSSDYTFSQGSLIFEHDVILSGSYSFNYATNTTSTIKTASRLVIDEGLTFSYAPIIAKQNLLYMTDETSILHMDGSTLHSTRTGMHIAGGSLVIDNKVTFSSEAKNSGEALVFDENLNIYLLGSAKLSVFGQVKHT